MHLSELQLENFRLFASGSKALDLKFGKGLTLLVGPNDGGKSAIIDAIRLVCGTTTRDWNRVVSEDFHCGDEGQASKLSIRCRIDFESLDEAAPYFEYLTPEKPMPALFLNLTATRDESNPRSAVTVDLRTGPSATGPRPDSAMQQSMATTYLRALRDALGELTSGKSSRLSQILFAYPTFVGQGESNFEPSMLDASEPLVIPDTLAGIMELAEEAIKRNSAIRSTVDRLNDAYLQPLSIADETIQGDIGITHRATLRQILEKLDLWILSASSIPYQRGLGTNNLLYMASEMLLVGNAGDGGLPLLLIEEPEAHLHPQLQLLVGDFLREQSDKATASIESSEVPDDNPDAIKTSLQTIATTHSPTLASQVKLEQIIVVTDGDAYPLKPELTGLDESDYRYLSKFLDATRANLFFARGVLIVEGDAETLLLPTLARLLGVPLNRYGISIVNVGSVGLFRYSRIFQSRKRDARIPVRVACLTDLDLPQSAKKTDKVKRRQKRWRIEGGPVRVFVSTHQTFEVDLAASAFMPEMHLAIALAKRAKAIGRPLDDTEVAKVTKHADIAFADLIARLTADADRAVEIYEPLRLNQASKTETAQFFGELVEKAVNARSIDVPTLTKMLPNYLVRAIMYAAGRISPPPHSPTPEDDTNEEGP